MPIPVTIIGGYLGSGKTTLVNHLLRNANGLKLAIMVNEFGELPIDADLIEAEDDTLISLSGGCVCCSYGNDLTMALIDMAKMQPRPDHIVLEASGVALPGSIASSLSLLSDYTLDGVVVVADAETVREKARDKYIGDTITRQLADADIVLLNKVDLLSESEAVAAEQWMEDTTATSVVVKTTNCSIAGEVVLQSFADRRRPEPGATSDSEHHLHGIESRSIAIDWPTDAESLARYLGQDCPQIVRAKGFVPTHNGLKTVQVVGHRHEVSDAPEGAACGIVLIGFASDDFDKIATRLAEKTGQPWN